MTWSSNPPTYTFGILPFVGSQWLGVDFHSWKSTLELIIVLPKQHYSNPKHSCQICLSWGWWAKPPHPHKLLGLWIGPLPHCQVTFFSYGLEASKHFPLANGARSPQQLRTIKTSFYDLWWYRKTTLPTSNLCVDANGPLTWPIWANIKEVMVV